MTLGSVKFYLDRLHQYAGKVQFLMVCWLFFQTVPWSWWILAGVLAGIPLLLWADLRYVVPSEFEMYMMKNPVWVKMQESMARLEEKP